MTTATATIETTSVDDNRITHRNACAYLKGYIVGYSKRRGMKWNGDVERTPQFKQGWEDSKRRSSETITFAHIIYNWLRHERPHLGREKRDEAFVAEFREKHAWKGGNHLLNALAELGVDIEEVLS
jgi:hypothetical protein